MKRIKWLLGLIGLALAGCTTAPEPCLIWYEDGDGVTMTVYSARSGDSQTYEPHHDGTVSVLDDCGEVCK